MDKFWELLQESIIVQALVTLALVGAVVFLTVTGREVPDALSSLAIMTLGYYFGSKAQLSATQAARSVVQQLREEEE